MPKNDYKYSYNELMHSKRRQINTFTPEMYSETKITSQRRNNGYDAEIKQLNKKHFIKWIPSVFIPKNIKILKHKDFVHDVVRYLRTSICQMD